jgi:hypothetical protein
VYKFETFRNQAFIDTEAEARAFEALMNDMARGKEMIVRDASGKKLKFPLYGALLAIGPCRKPIFANRLEKSAPADGQTEIALDDYERLYGFIGDFKFSTLLGHGWWCAPHVAIRADVNFDKFNVYGETRSPQELKTFIAAMREKCSQLRSVQVSYNPGKITGQHSAATSRLFLVSDDFANHRKNYSDLKETVRVESTANCDLYASAVGDFDKPVGVLPRRTPETSAEAIERART